MRARFLPQKVYKVVFRKAYGYACKYDYDRVLPDKSGKMTMNHLFDIASLTKAAGTTTSFMLPADRGLPGIENPVGHDSPMGVCLTRPIPCGSHRFRGSLLS